MVGKNNLWQQDAIFASQRLNGMYPWFIQRVVNLAAFQRNFPVTDAMLDGLLPANQTLATLASARRLYYVSQCGAEWCTARPRSCDDRPDKPVLCE